mmetsp:Transcript_56020/g.120155  ORF Transcript_56020/g.120155 Transcript_56020/m.120155 type:complete len:604 (-) Transcript_56020:101-1912(-)
MGGLEGGAVVVRGAAEGVHHVLAGGLLHADQLGAFEKHVDPLVALQTLEQPVQDSGDTFERPHALEQFVLAVQNTLLDRELQPHCASCSDVRSGPRQHQQRVLCCTLVNLDVLARFQKQCGEHIEVVISDVDVVVSLPQAGGVVGLHATKASDKIIGELPADLPLLVLSALKVELDPRILQAPVEEVLHSRLNVGISAESLDEGDAVPDESLLLPVVVAQDGGAAGLNGDQHLINQALRVAGTHHSTRNIAHETVEMIVVDSQALMGLNQLSPLVGLGAPQQLADVRPLPSLDHFDVLHQQMCDTLVSPTNLVQLLQQVIQALAAPKTLEHDILALLHVLAGHLHPDGESSGYVRASGLQVDQHLCDNPLVPTSVAQHLRNNLHQTVKMVVRDVGFVVGWSQIFAIVRGHTSECPTHKSGNALLHAGGPGLVALEKTLHPGIRSRRGVHGLSHLSHALLPPKSLVDGLGGDGLHGLLDVVGPLLAQHLWSQDLQEDDTLIRGLGVQAQPPHSLTQRSDKTVELIVSDGHSGVNAIQGSAGVVHGASEQQCQILANLRYQRGNLGATKEMHHTRVLLEEVEHIHDKLADPILFAQAHEQVVRPG